MPATQLGGIYTSDPRIVEGWREKTLLSNLELSNLIPFLKLYALLSPQEALTFRNTDGANLIKITLINSKKETTTIDACPLANLESQLESIGKRGGVGLISASIQRGAANSFNEIIEVSMNLSDYQVFKVIPVYQKLIERNSEYVIFYGWSTRKAVVPDVDKNGVLVLDENANTKGYWNFMRIVLFGYDYSFESDTSIAMKMNFYTQFGASVAMTKAGLYGETVINALKSFNDKNSKNSDLGQIANAINKLGMAKDKLTNNPGIVVQQDRQITIGAGEPPPTLEPGEEFVGGGTDNSITNILGGSPTTGNAATDASLDRGSEHFKIRDLIITSKDLPNLPDQNAATNLEKLANNVLEVIYVNWGPIRITSGYRSQAVNSAEPDSSATSKHLTGLAVDFVPDDGRSLTYLADFVTNLINNKKLTRVWMEPMSQAKDHIHLSYTP